ncbi:MAG TPA: hypothetical protein VN903_31185 [Polyangia bacterium]|nr:hypothetical protein [Polyangia bacterium]
MARTFGGLFAFAYARPTGAVDHPALIPHVEAIVAALAPPVPGPSPTPPPPAPPPAPPPPFSPRIPAVLQGPPPTPVAAPRSYPHINQITDPAAAKSLRLLWDAHYAVLDQQKTIAATQSTHAASLTSLGTQVTAAQTTATQALRTTTAAGPTGGTPPPGGNPPPPSPPGGGTPPPPDEGGQGNLGCSSAGPTGHVTAGAPLTPYTMGLIVCGTYAEFSSLGAIVVDQPTRDANRFELLGRMIWHLNLAGFTAARYPGTHNPYTLLIQAPGYVYTYRVVDYASFDVVMFSTMVLATFGPGVIETPDGGIAD